MQDTRLASSEFEIGHLLLQMVIVVFEPENPFPAKVISKPPP